MALVGTLNVALQATTQDFENGLRRAQTQVKGFGATVTSIQGTLTGFGATLLKMGVAAVGIGSIAAAIKEVVTAGAQLQTTTSAFTGLTGSSTATAAALDLARTQADKLGFGLNDLRNSLKTLIASTQDMNVAGASTEQIFTTVTNSGRTLQLSADQTRTVMDNMAAALRRGTITTQDLQTGFGGLPNLMKLAAQAMDLDTAAVKRLADEQGLMTTLTLPRLLTAIQATWGSKAVQAAETLESSFGKLKNTIQQVGEALAKLGGNRALELLLELWKLRAAGVQSVVDVVNKGTPLPPDLSEALKGLPAKGSGSTTEANALIDAALAKIQRQTEEFALIRDELAKAQKILGEQQQSFFGTNKPTKSDELNLTQTSAWLADTQARYAAALAGIKASVQEIITSTKGVVTESAQAVKNDAANALAKLKELQEQGKVIQEDAQRNLELFPENRLAILAKQEADLKKLLETMQTLRTHPMVDTEGDAQATVRAVKEIDKTYQGLRDTLKAVQLAQQELKSDDELIKTLQQLEDVKLRLQLNNPTDADFLRLADQPKRLREEQGLRERFAVDPAGTRLSTLGRISGLQEEVERLNSANTVRDMGLDQRRQALNELTRGEIAYGQSLSAQLTELSKTHKGLGENRDAQIAATLALANATEEEQLNVLAIRERNKALQQQLVDMQNHDAVRKEIEGLTAQRDALLLSDNARIASRLAKLDATDADKARAQALAQEIKQLQGAAQVVETLENAFLELATTGKISLQSLAQEFQRLALSILFEASGIKKALTSIVAQGLQGLFGGVSTSQGPLQGPTQSGPTLDVAPNAGGGMAGGGAVLGHNPYPVGERGWEMFVPAVNGRILSHEDSMAAVSAGAQPSGGQAQINYVTVNVHGVTDLPTWQRSRGEIDKGIMRGIQNASRAA